MAAAALVERDAAVADGKLRRLTAPLATDTHRGLARCARILQAALGDETVLPELLAVFPAKPHADAFWTILAVGTMHPLAGATILGEFAVRLRYAMARSAQYAGQ